MPDTNLLSLNDNGTFNRHLVRIAGLEAAVYAAEISDIYQKAINKSTIDENGFITLDRNYIENRIGLAAGIQKDCEMVLASLKIVEVDILDANKIKIDLAALMSVITASDMDAKELTNKLKVVKKNKSATSKAGQATEFKNRLVKILPHLAQDPELRLAYVKWIEGVFASNKRFITDNIIRTFDTEAHKITDHLVRLSIVNVAARLGYTEFSWALSVYEKEKKDKAALRTLSSDSKKPTETLNQATKLSTDFSF